MARAAFRSAICSRTSASCVDDLCVVRSMVGEGRGPRRRAAADFHRHQHLHAAEHGLVGAIRPGQRESGSAGLHHHQAGALARRREELGLGVPARIVPGHGHRQCRHEGGGYQGRADRISAQQEIHCRSSSATSSTCCRTSTASMPRCAPMIRSWRRAFRPSSWLSGCKPRRPSLSGGAGIRGDQEAVRPG